MSEAESHKIHNSETLLDEQFVFVADDGIESRAIIAPASNPLLSQQWYVDAGASGSTATTRVNTIWAEATGSGVSVAVMDSGFQQQHLDLASRLGLGSGASGVSASNDHGTQVAGVLGADGANNFGIVGIAYNATLTQVDFSYVTASPTRAEVADTLRTAGQSDVVNASWGYRGQFQDNFADAAWAGHRDAIVDMAANGRDGLGSAIVFAAGNDRQYIAGSSVLDGDNTNYHSLTNARQIITVGASDQFGKAGTFSTPGASVLVAAPGVSIFTTGVISGRESATDGFETVSGTSFSAPIVSGVIAMMLEVNPDLGYRDIQTILSATAQRTGDVSAWAVNGAGNWNGGGMLVNHDLGFGVVDARAAVRLAQTWNEVAATAANEQSIAMVANATAPQTLADGSSLTRTFTLPAGADAMELEWIELDFSITHRHIGDLTVTITSPSGMTSTLVDRPGAGNNTRDNLSVTLTSAQFRGEDPAGTWSVTVKDAAGNGSYTVDKLALRLYGAEASDDTTHIFTDDVAKLQDRGTLADALGSNTINLSAMTLDNTLKLAGGASRLGGNDFRVEAGSKFSNVIGGDGSDYLDATGVSYAVTLRGGAGRDVLIGGAGTDTLNGGAGNDVLYAGASDTLDGGDGDDVFFAAGLGETLIGGAGYDTVDFTRSAAGVILDLATMSIQLAAGSVSMSGIENFIVSGQADYVAGSSGADIVYLGGGADTARGAGGADMLNGMDGNDRLFGEDGNDMMIGGRGSDLLMGGDGTDMLFGEEGDDMLFADLGGASLLDGGEGNDTLYGGTGNDYVVGGTGDDIMLGMGGQNSMFGGEGRDILVSGDGAGSVLDGGAGADMLWGGSGEDYAVGAEGDDVIVMGAGSDYIFGGAGNDVILAGEETDYIFGNEGDDFIYTDELGTRYSDYVFVGGGTGTDTIVDFTAGNGADHDVLVISLATGFTNFEQLKGVMAQAGVYTTISLGNDHVYLYNVSSYQMTADNVMFL